MRMKSSRLLRMILLCVLCLGSVPSFAASANAAVSSYAITSMAGLKQQILASMGQRETVMSFSYKGSINNLSSQIERALKEAIDADDYIQYVIDQYSFQWRSKAGSTNITIYMEYREDKAQTDWVNRRIKQVLPTIIDSSMNDHEKVKAIHDWIVLHVAYDTSLVNDTPYAALTDGTTVCQGYALLTYKMLKDAGIENKIVEGTADDQLHAWNLVKLNSQWYHLDTTWDDPVPDQQGKVSYSYYLRTDAQMKVDHYWTKAYPAAVQPYNKTLEALKSKDMDRSDFYQQLETDLDYIYYKPEYTASTSSQLVKFVKDALTKGQSFVKVRYTSKNTLKTDMGKVVQQVDGIEGLKYKYRDFNKSDVLLEIKTY